MSLLLEELADELKLVGVASDGGLSLALDAGLLELPLEVLVVDRKLADTGKNTLGLLDLALGDEETRGL